MVVLSLVCDNCNRGESREYDCPDSLLAEHPKAIPLVYENGIPVTSADGYDLYTVYGDPLPDPHSCPKWAKERLEFPKIGGGASATPG